MMCCAGPGPSCETPPARPLLCAGLGWPRRAPGPLLSLAAVGQELPPPPPPEMVLVTAKQSPPPLLLERRQRRLLVAVSDSGPRGPAWASRPVPGRPDLHRARYRPDLPGRPDLERESALC